MAPPAPGAADPRTGAGRQDAAARLADAVDSMGLVELVALLADDCGVTPDAIEKAVSHRFGTVAELAAALAAAGLVFRPAEGEEQPSASLAPSGIAAGCWLSGATLRLPRAVQTAKEIDERLRRPPGWLERHAGIRQRHVWQEEDALAAAAEAGSACLHEAGLLAEEVGALLVASEAPPLLAGLAAALHHRLGLRRRRRPWRLAAPAAASLLVCGWPG